MRPTTLRLASRPTTFVLLALLATASLTAAGTAPAFAAAGDISTAAGTGSAGYSGDGGPATAAELNGPTGVSFTSTGDMLIADFGGHVVRRVDHSSGVITTIAGTGTPGSSGDGGPATAATLNLPASAIADAAGDVYIAELSGNVVRKIDHVTGTISTVAGTGAGFTDGDGGPATAAGLKQPVFVHFDAAGNIFVSEYYGCTIRRIDKVTGTITTVVGIPDSCASDGDGGPATAARINVGWGFAFNTAGDLVLADVVGHTVRKVDHTTGTITRIVGTGDNQSTSGVRPALGYPLSYPTDVAYDSAGNLYIANSGLNRVARMDTFGYVGNVVGTGGTGYDGDGGPAIDATINNPDGLAFDAGDNLFIAENGNNVIREVTGPFPPFPIGGIAANFDGDDRSDISVYRPGAPATWFAHPSSGGADTALSYGGSGDVAVPGDYDGDTKTDQAIYRPSTGLWSIRNSSDNTDTAMTFGGVAGDMPIPADYDGDGKVDLGVFRPSVGTWYTHLSGDSSDHALMFGGGVAGDIPAPADFNGDGRADKVIFRPSTGTWFVHLTNSFESDYAISYGASGDIPLPGDYDGDTKADIAIFRPSTGLWAIHYSGGGPDTFVTYGGVAGDVPIPADFDGDHKTDIAIFRPAFGAWFAHQSITNTDAITTFGISGDVPLQLPAAVRSVFF